MNVVISSLIGKMNCTDGTSVKRLKDGMRKSSLQSMTSTLYVNDKTFLKVFKDDKVSQGLMKREYNAYRFLNTIKELEPYIPKMLQSSMNKNNSFLLLENRGIDALELVNSDTIDMDYYMWGKFIVDISTALEIIHSYGISHGDMKPENTTYDVHLDKWSIIDFGFAARDGFVCSRFYGTIPYCSPHNTVDYIKKRTQGVTNMDLNAVNDLFGFAMAALTLFGFYFDVDTNPHVSYSITNLVKIYEGDYLNGLCPRYVPKNVRTTELTTRVLKLLAAMVLTQLDFTYSEVVWVKKSCQCYFRGPTNAIPCGLENFDIEHHWRQLLTIIRN